MSGKAVRETLAALGVIASLVFVGTEIRQNTTMARAEARQALSDATAHLREALYSDAELRRDIDDWARSEDGTVPNCRESGACMFTRAALRNHENVFLQVQEGLLDESAFISYGYSNNSRLFVARVPILLADHPSTAPPRLRSRLRGRVRPRAVAAHAAD